MPQVPALSGPVEVIPGLIVVMVMKGGPYGLPAYNPTANTVVSKRTSMAGFCFPPVSDETRRAT
jgi:hypothetical protein